MAKLTAAERRRIPTSEFGLPEKRAYPMPDDSHARFAKSAASKAEHKGNITMAEEKKIDRKADRVLGKRDEPMTHGAGGAAKSKHVGAASEHKHVVNRGSHHEKMRHC